LRDIPRTYVLFVWIAFAVAAFLYAYDWRPMVSVAAARSRGEAPAQ